MPRLHRALPLAALFALACGDKDGGDDTDTAPPEEQQDPDAPILTNADAYCYLHNTGDEVEFWSLQVSFDDAQGLEDVPRQGHDIEILREGNVVDTINDIIVCDPSAGNCFGSFQAAAYGMACANAEAFTIRFLITDYEGHVGSVETQGYED